MQHERPAACLAPSPSPASVVPVAVAMVPAPSEADMNKISAKILRAELMGNKAQVASLQDQLAAMKQRLAAAPSVMPSDTPSATPLQQETQVLIATNRDGSAMPVRGQHIREDRQDSRSRQLRKKFKADTHDSGERQRYFADDDKFSLHDLVEQERRGGAGGPEDIYGRLASGVMARTDDDDYTMDDLITDRAGRSQPQGRQEDRARQHAVRGHQHREATLGSCWFCLDNPKLEKHLIVSLGVKVYLAIPAKGRLAEGHALLVPVRHSTSTVALDEDVWDEMRMFQQCLVQMWQAQDMDVVFLETVMNLNRQHHTVIHAIPLDRDSGALAPMYFKVSSELLCRSEGERVLLGNDKEKKQKG